MIFKFFCFFCLISVCLVANLVSCLEEKEQVSNEIDNESVLHHHHHHEYNHQEQCNSVKKFGENAASNSFFSSKIILVGLISSLVFAFIGIIPAFFVKVGEEDFKKSLLYKITLAFAAGSLMSEVFLHFIPQNSKQDDKTQIRNGLLTIASFFLFMIIEKISDALTYVKALGILNLIANLFDNSAHGSTVVGAYQTSNWLGSIALISTLLHEIPHEFGDFSLLLKSNFTKTKAITYQLITAFAGSFAATITQYWAQDDGSCSAGLGGAATGGAHSLILCFTIGGFLYIALVGIIPEMMEEEDTKTSLYQFVAFISGVLLIFVLLNIENMLSAHGIIE